MTQQLLKGTGHSSALVDPDTHNYKINYTNDALDELEADESAFVLDSSVVLATIPNWAPVYAIRRPNDDVDNVYTKADAQEIAQELIQDLQNDDDVMVKPVSNDTIDYVIDYLLATATWQTLETVKEELLNDIYDCLRTNESVYDWLCTAKKDI